MATVLTIGGSTVDRAASRVVLQRLTLSMDGPDVLEFSQIARPADCGDCSGLAPVTLTIDGTLYFTGTLTRPTPQGVGRGAITVAYTALGFRYAANNVFVTGSDGTGSMAWNLDPTDPYYLPSNSGKNVGEILTNLLEQHSTQLTALGIGQFTGSTLPAATIADLALLTVVPPTPITLGGRLWDAAADLLSQWQPRYAIWIAPDGLIKIKDTTALAATTLTLDSDQVVLEQLVKDHSDCYTRVVCRGMGDIQPAYLSLSEGTLEWDQLPADQAAWKIDDFLSPKGAAEVGAVTGMTSTPRGVTVDAAGSQPAHAAHFWSTIEAYVYAYDPAATGITFQEFRQITDNDADGGSGTSYTITVGAAFDHTGYSRYAVRGTRTAGSMVWRKLKILPVDGSGDNYVAQHLARLFPRSVAWSPVDGAVTLTQTPVANVCWSASGSPPWTEFPAALELVLYDGSTNGYLILGQPAPAYYTSQTALHTPGASVGPGDVRVCVPYSLGALSAQWPASGYGGTAYTVDGIERVLYLDYPQWRDKGASTAMTTLAKEKWYAVRDTIHEGSIAIEGKDLTWLALGRSLNLARSGGTTGWEAIAAPVRSASIEWPQDGGAIWRTTLGFSTRRKPFTGDQLYVRPQYGSQSLGGIGEGMGGLAAAWTARTGSLRGFDPTDVGPPPEELGMPIYGSDVGARNTYDPGGGLPTRAGSAHADVLLRRRRMTEARRNGAKRREMLAQSREQDRQTIEESRRQASDELASAPLEEPEIGEGGGL